MRGETRSTRFLLAIIAALLGASLLVQMNNSGGPRALAAGIPDSGAQLQAVADQISDLNKKVEKLDNFLESGSLVVTTKAANQDK